MFNHEGHPVLRMMHNLTVGVFGHLEIKSDMDVEKRIKYMKHILRGTSFKKQKQIMEEHKESEKGIAIDKWTLVSTKDVTMENFWDWANMDDING